MENIAKEEILSAQDLSLSYGKGLVAAGLSLSLKRGETFCIVGESGCGKSTLMKAILGNQSVKVRSGKIFYQGEDITDLPISKRRKILGTGIGFVPQDPVGSFNPIRTYEKQFRETLKSHGLTFDRKEAIRCFEVLSLDQGERILNSRPYEMSGGMNQRIAIALCLLLKPKILLCDEATSALDVTTQLTVVHELEAFQKANDAAILLITHNLGLAARLGDRIGIMYGGHMVEYGSTEDIMNHPAHPYTRCLLRAVPKISGEEIVGLEGQPPLKGGDMETCTFLERCPWAKECGCDGSYQLHDLGNGHFSHCIQGMKQTKGQIDGTEGK